MSKESVEKFVLERTKEGKEEEAKKLVNDFFIKQDKNEIDTKYMLGLVPKAVGVLKPEFLAEVKEKFEEVRDKIKK